VVDARRVESTDQLYIWMRAAEFEQRGLQLPEHVVRRRIEDGRWIYDEQTLCGRPVPEGLGFSLGLKTPPVVCGPCVDKLLTK